MKRLVVCCDGTWHRAGKLWHGKQAPTNVARFAARVVPADGGVRQLLWYDAGLATRSPLRQVAGTTGEDLDDTILDAYRFLVTNYVPGDELFVVGFSRGAYVVRSLVGMLRKCGIVKRARFRAADAALALYRNDEHPEAEGPTAFRSSMSVVGSAPIPIQFLGVWDTVGALGVPSDAGLSRRARKRNAFHDTELPGCVARAHHALAIDERRRALQPALWTSLPKPGQQIEQVWFCGTHRDIGGGGNRKLADVALQWMLDRAKRAGLALRSEASTYSLAPDPLAKFSRLESWHRWNVLGLSPREIGVGSTQSLHPSVGQRWRALDSYRPANLRPHFGEVRRLAATAAFT